MREIPYEEPLNAGVGVEQIDSQGTSDSLDDTKPAFEREVA